MVIAGLLNLSMFLLFDLAKMLEPTSDDLTDVGRRILQYRALHLPPE